jgi:hydroxymethylpyrimidine kinase/phosphomethylpyrimidine kinase/thiamine-phosphate diphosphorylase
LLPVCTLLTPNIDEAKRLTGLAIDSVDDVVVAAKKILSFGTKAVLIKGGHLSSETTDLVQDYFSDGERSFWLSSEKKNTHNMRGTGCALSSAISSAIALGYSLYDAVVIGKMAISQALRESYSLSGSDISNSACENGPVNITRFPDQQIDLPYLSASALNNIDLKAFPECNQPLLGLYPVVDRAQWIEKLAPSGITTIQLRVKDLSDKTLEEEIQQAITLAQKNNIRLFINDYWQLAIRYGAYGVHLGQEDLDTASIEQIKNAGLRLGISTHCHYEVARAHLYQPSYIACGPVYHTTTKDMPWVPHGLEGLSYWRTVLDYPLVAIGGINNERFDHIASTAVDSIAMITAITLANDPVSVATDFMCRFRGASVNDE